MDAGNPVGTVVNTPRLILEPLVPAHAAEMVAVLADPGLYEFTGGQPPTLEVLTHRYVLQSSGPLRQARHFNGQAPAGDPWYGTERWLNWIIRTRDTASPAGFIQATVLPAGPTARGTTAELAWVVGRQHQGRGYATEAAQAMVGELIRWGVDRFSANIHPANLASAAVAVSLGLRPTGLSDGDGEDIWTCDGEAGTESGRGNPDQAPIR